MAPAAAAAPQARPAAAMPAPGAARGKVLLLIIDGVGDVSIPAFGDRTPLQVAHTPNLDAIAGERRSFAAHLRGRGEGGAQREQLPCWPQRR
mgnify:CR=1 FL=1